MRLLPVLALLAITASASSCGSSDASSSSDPAPQEDPVLATEEFLEALGAQDAEGFCRLTTDDIQRDNFATAGVPNEGSCEERAEAMFAASRPDGTVPFWELAAEAEVGTIDLRCKPGTEDCSTATMVIEGLPLRDGGTTSAPLPLTNTASGWRVGSR